MTVSKANESSQNQNYANSSPHIHHSPRQVPSSVWVISIASMLLTLSACVISTTGPVFLFHELNVSGKNLGLLEGTVELISQFLRFLSGALSDTIINRKTLMVIGFSGSTLSKLFFPFIVTYGGYFAAKVFDRIGNGVQAAPRDALIGDFSPKKIRGRCYGMAQSLRKFGATFGAVFATVLLWNHVSYKTIFAVAILPAFLSILFLIFLVKSPAEKHEGQKKSFVVFVKGFMENVQYLGRSFWVLMGVITLYSIAHFNESFLQKHAKVLGGAESETAFIVVILCLATAIAAYPLGMLSDKIGKKRLFGTGIFFMIISNYILGHFYTLNALYIATTFWGFHWAVTQGLLLSLVVDVAPKKLKGTAFGVYYITTGIFAMVGNVICGSILDHFSKSAMYSFSSTVAIISIIALFGASKMNWLTQRDD